MPLPQVAIVGRPNVGKSSLFNWLAGRRLAIVEDTPGVTRDRMTHVIEEQDRRFAIVDTGGMGIKDIDNLTEDIEGQITAAIQSAAVLVFVVDAQAGLTSLDRDVAQRLRAAHQPVIFVANKADTERIDRLAAEVYELGCEEVIPTSTVHNRNKWLLLERIAAVLSSEDEIEDDSAEPVMKLAIVGRRNTGKSTFVNELAKTERMIVSEVAGTTRDSVDVMFELDGKQFMAIDTPGLRREKSLANSIEFYGARRAERTIRRADVVLLFLDAAEEISKVDKKLISYIEAQYKPCIFVVNKWDLLVDKAVTGEFAQYIHDTFPRMTHAPIAFITAKTGRNVKKLVNHAQMLFAQARTRVETGTLNRLIQAALERTPPPVRQRRRGKIFFATQVAAAPPTVVFMCNEPSLFEPTYRRYLLGVLRDQLDFGEVPV
ncbi:MAG: ribosome biogenesis GTPase Der, partial [Pirellulales bacterium]|nr:ribosome biogenesis GTPase Der [Pirellulales bacterium]